MESVPENHDVRVASSYTANASRFYSLLSTVFALSLPYCRRQASSFLLRSRHCVCGRSSNSRSLDNSEVRLNCDVAHVRSFRTGAPQSTRETGSVRSTPRFLSDDRVPNGTGREGLTSPCRTVWRKIRQKDDTRRATAGIAMHPRITQTHFWAV